MGNRFTRTAPVKNEIDIEKQEQQIQNKTVEEATEEMKVMIYSPGHPVKEGKVDGFEAQNGIKMPQNGIEKGQNGTMNGTKTTKTMKIEQMENGHNSAVGESSSLEMNSTKKMGQNGHIGQLAVNNKVENANGKMAGPRKCGVASGQKRQTKTEIAAAGRRRGRPSRKFTGHQIKMLEKKFQTTQYMALPDRVELARELGLTQTQVKVWFANRRQQQKKRVRKITRDKRTAAWQLEEEDEAEEEEEQAEMEEEFEE